MSWPTLPYSTLGETKDEIQEHFDKKIIHELQPRKRSIAIRPWQENNNYSGAFTRSAAAHASRQRQCDRATSLAPPPPLIAQTTTDMSEEHIVVDDDDNIAFGEDSQAHHQDMLMRFAGVGSSEMKSVLAGSMLAGSSGGVGVGGGEQMRAPVKVIKRDRDSIVQQNCMVCDALTSGFHFGAISCAACSAFFRRTIAEKRKYVCRKEGDEHLNCPINQEQRCYCRACRLQKCLLVGMDPNAVQPHRDVIGGKRSRQPTVAVTAGPAAEERPCEVRAPIPIPHSHNVASIEQTLADHLQRNREFAAVARSTLEKPLNPVLKNSPTAQLLTSNAFAEQLLAFSRTPVIKGAAGEKEEEAAGAVGGAVVGGAVSKKSSTAHSDPGFTSLDFEGVDANVVCGGVSSACAAVSSGHGSCVDEEGEGEGEGDSSAATSSAASPGRNPATAPVDDCSRGGLYASAGPYDPTRNIIAQMVVAYRGLTERRRLIYCPNKLRDLLGCGNPEPRKVRFFDPVLKSRFRVELGLILDFINSIVPFTKFKLDDKIVLFKHVSVSYSILEKYYNTMKGGGLHSNRIIHVDNTYFDLNGEPEMSDTQLSQMDMPTLKKLFIHPLKEGLQDISGAMFHGGMTDVEFCALVAILLFDPAASPLSESTRRVVKEARDRVYRDWFSYYSANDVQDASQRVGNTMLLLPSIQSTCEKTQENLHLVRVFELGDYDEIIDEILMQ